MDWQIPDGLDGAALNTVEAEPKGDRRRMIILFLMSVSYITPLSVIHMPFTLILNCSLVLFFKVIHSMFSNSISTTYHISSSIALIERFPFSVL